MILRVLKVQKVVDGVDAYNVIVFLELFYYIFWNLKIDFIGKLSNAEELVNIVLLNVFKMFRGHLKEYIYIELLYDIIF